MSLLVALMAACAFVVTSSPAAASASLTIDPQGSVGGSPYGLLRVHGIATCSTPSGMATLNVSALQVVGHMANGRGSATIDCAEQPAYWSVVLGPDSFCSQLNPGSSCFRRGYVASAFVGLVKDGVTEAFRAQVISL